MNSEEEMERRSLKKGMTSAMMKARTVMAVMRVSHEIQPALVLM